MSDKIRKFEFEQKDSYTPMEVEAIVGQHKSYMKNISGTSTKEMEDKIKELETANKEFSTKERNRLVKKLAKETSEDNYEKIIKYAQIPADADEAQIKTILGEVAKDFVAPVDTAEKKVVEVKKATIQEPKEKPKARRFTGA